MRAGGSYLLALASLWAIFAGPVPLAHGRNLDGTIGMIRRPLSTYGVMRSVGEPFEIECETEPGASDWRASLILPGAPPLQIELPIDYAQSDDGQRWRIGTHVPEGTPEECYDLAVDSSTGADMSQAAVKVVLSYPNEFYFVHISDDHIGAFPGHDGSTLLGLIEEFHILSPQFVVDTGDCTQWGLEEEFRDFVDIIETMRLPRFIVLGNHDIDHVQCALLTGQAREDHRAMMHQRWESYIGPRDFSFDFGPVHGALVEISGFEDYDPEVWPDVCPYADLEPEQVDWLRQDLEDHQDSILRFVGAHQTEDDNSNLREIFNSEAVRLFLYGHLHDDAVQLLGDTPTITARTAASYDGHYRLVRVSDGEIVSHSYGGSASASIPGGGMLSLDLSAANDGSAEEITATITNDLDERFEHSKLRFLVPADVPGYVVEGGAVFQSFNVGSITAIYVEADVQPLAQTIVTVRGMDPPAVWLEPERGPEAGGNTVTIHGQDFDPGGDAKVLFGLRSAVVSEVTPERILVVAPAGTGAVNVAGTSGSAGFVLVDGYQYLPPPAILSVEPTSGPETGGNEVMVMGTGFAGSGNTLVTFGDAPAQVLAVSTESATVVAPPGRGFVDVTLANPYGSDTLELGYEYVPLSDVGPDAPEDSSAGCSCSAPGAVPTGWLWLFIALIGPALPRGWQAIRRR